MKFSIVENINGDRVEKYEKIGQGIVFLFFFGALFSRVINFDIIENTIGENWLILFVLLYLIIPLVILIFSSTIRSSQRIKTYNILGEFEIDDEILIKDGIIYHYSDLKFRIKLVDYQGSRFYGWSPSSDGTKNYLYINDEAYQFLLEEDYQYDFFRRRIQYWQKKHPEFDGKF